MRAKFRIQESECGKLKSTIIKPGQFFNCVIWGFDGYDSIGQYTKKGQVILYCLNDDKKYIRVGKWLSLKEFKKTFKFGYDDYNDIIFIDVYPTGTDIIDLNNRIGDFYGC